MSMLNLGRVQGGGIFYSTASSATSITKSTLTPTGLVPLVGDCVVFANGDLRKIAAVNDNAVTCGKVEANLHGQNGVTPEIGPNGNWFINGQDSGKPARGETGADGADGLGVPAGGTMGQVLIKLSDADNDTAWTDKVPNASQINDITIAKLGTRIQVAGAIDEQKTIGIYYKKNIKHSFNQGTFILTLDLIDITESGRVEYDFYIEYEEYDAIKTVVFNVKFDRDRVIHDVAGLYKQMYPLCAPAFSGGKILYIEPLIYKDEDNSLKLKIEGVWRVGNNFGDPELISGARIMSVIREIF